MLTSAPTAHGGGATILVTSSADTDDGFCNWSVLNGCTLREAINWANLVNPNSADTIIFAPAAFPDPYIISLNSPLPLFTDPAGVTVDGALTGSHRVQISPSNGVGIYFGLVFAGDEVNNVTVQNFRAALFVYDGIQVCPKPNNEAGTCDGPADGVTLNNVVASGNAHSGVEVLGTNINNVEMTSMYTTDNVVDGVDIQSGGDLSGVHFSAGVVGFNDIRDNGGDGFNLSGGVVNDISFAETNSDNNGGDGIQIAASALSGLTISGGEADSNDGRGVDIDIVGSLSNVSVETSKFDLNTDYGISVEAGSFGNGLFYNNEVKDNFEFGLYIDAGEISDVTVQNNTFTSKENLFFAAPRGVDNLVASNSIQGGNRGVQVIGDGLQVQISRNSMSGIFYPGIDLAAGTDNSSGFTPNDPGDADQGPNTLLNFPEFSGVTAEALTGTTCANCLVEVFVADGAAGNRGDGQTFLRDSTADGSGNFSVSLCQLNKPAGTVVTATATDPGGNTSEFSTNVALISATANCPTPTATPVGQTPTPTPTATPVGQTPTPTPTATPVGQTPSPTPVGQTPTPSPTLAPGQHAAGDLDCDGHVTPFDALAFLLFEADLGFFQNQPCPGMADTIGGHEFADVNCDGVTNGEDAIPIMQFFVGVPIKPPLPGGCTPVGQAIG